MDLGACRKRGSVNGSIVATYQAALRTLREREGWTYAEMGERLGFSAPRAHVLENGSGGPTLSTAARTAAAFGLTLCEFLSVNETVDRQA